MATIKRSLRYGQFGGFRHMAMLTLLIFYWQPMQQVP
jgi:hypothetical protein